MINHNLSEYLESNFNDTKKTITDISKSDNDKGSLVCCDKLMYNFDDISERIYSNNKPASADGIIVVSNNVYLVEFKTGFKQTITKENFDPKKMTCPRYELKCSKIKKDCPDYKLPEIKDMICSKTGNKCFKSVNYCEDYGKIFLDLQKKKKDELYQSIRIKAIESYITLEKEILSQCQKFEKSLSLNLIIVIDGNGDAANMAILDDLSGKKIDDKENDYINLEKSLSKYKNKKVHDGTSYYYDTIAVMGSAQFQKFAKEKFA